MKKNFTFKAVLCLVVSIVLSLATAEAATTRTALWDFQNMNPSSLSGLKIEGDQDHVASTNSSINMFVIAKSGKFAVRTSDVQVNANTYLRIPVQSTSDKVTIVSYPGYYNYSINGTAANANTYTYTATSSDVSQGFVQVQATSTCYLYSVKVVQKVSTAVTALWDFQNVNPSTLSGLSIEGKQGHIPSTLSDVSIYCIGQYGKFAQRTSDAQLNAKTTLRVPVTSTSDVVTVTSYPGYHNYAVGGTAATADVTTHTATSSEVSQGYVVIYASATSYLYSIKAVLNAYTGSGTATSSSSGSSSSSSSSTSTTDNTTTASANFTAVSQNYYIVSAGSASGFLSALAKANSSTSSGRKYIFLPNGTYNLGTTCLTAITGSKISIIGQSMDKTIIKNAPSTANEGISTTATLLNKGSYNYFQDLTIQNDLDYYNAGSAGRAVTLQDKGNYTICKNVKLKSYQDTYYSNNSNGRFYWEDSELHGVVDFLCGGGDVFYNRCNIVVETRGGDVIAAPNGQRKYGYVFLDCEINGEDAENGKYHLGRPWGAGCRAQYINTRMNILPYASGWTEMSGNAPAVFAEYNSTDKSGNSVDLSGRKLTFEGGTQESAVLTEEQVAELSIANVMGSSDGWNPQLSTEQAPTPTNVALSGNTLTWNGSDYVLCWAVCKNGSVVAFTTTAEYTVDDTTASYSVRAANEMGGLGEAAEPTTETSIREVAETEDVVSTHYFNTAGIEVGSQAKGVVLKVMKLKNGKTVTLKVVK